MKGVGWETEGCMNIAQAKKAGELLSDVSAVCGYISVSYWTLHCIRHTVDLPPFFSQTKYRQKADSIGFTQVADDLSIKHAKKSQELQSDVRASLWSCNRAVHFITVHYSITCLSDFNFQLAYKANTEQIIHQYTMTKDEPLFRQAKANADLLSGVSFITMSTLFCHILNWPFEIKASNIHKHRSEQ